MAWQRAFAVHSSAQRVSHRRGGHGAVTSECWLVAACYAGRAPPAALRACKKSATPPPARAAPKKVKPTRSATFTATLGAKPAAADVDGMGDGDGEAEGVASGQLSLQLTGKISGFPEAEQARAVVAWTV